MASTTLDLVKHGMKKVNRCPDKRIGFSFITASECCESFSGVVNSLFYHLLKKTISPFHCDGKIKFFYDRNAFSAQVQ